MSFKSEKKSFLSKPDKSGIGGIDDAIKPLLRALNRKEDYYTTSSCAGRIVLMIETGKKQENAFVFVSHRKVSLKELKEALKSDKRAQKAEFIYLKEEPVILHVACKDPEKASKLVEIARQCGWKKSGIISLKKSVVELGSTERLEAPVMKKGKVIVDDAYLDVLARECNKKLTQTREKMRKLEAAVKNL